MSLLIDVVKRARGKSIDKATQPLQRHRKGLCIVCPHYNAKTDSCGGLFKGGTVEHEGQKAELCGCIMSDKVKYANDGCPLGKW